MSTTTRVRACARRGCYCLCCKYAARKPVTPHTCGETCDPGNCESAHREHFGMESPA